MGNVLPNLMNESIFSCFQIPLRLCSCIQVQIEMLNVILFHFVSAYNTAFKPADSVGGTIPIETCGRVSVRNHYFSFNFGSIATKILHN